METTEIRDLVRRLARPHGSDRVIVEGTAIRAAGSDFDVVEAWIVANGGKPQAQAPRPQKQSGGLFGDRFKDSDASRSLETARYVLPASALVAPAVDEAPESGDEPDDQPTEGP